MKKAISILGSTGSIGTQSLEVARSHEMQIYALAANRNVDALEQQAREFLPKKVCIFETEKYAELKQRLADLPVQVLCGMEGLCDIASDKNADILINSVVGMVGLLPTLTAISAGLDIALANKETLVAGGSLVMEQAAKKGVRIYPVDSEHSANKITIDSATLMNKGLEFIEAKWLFDLTPEQIEIVVHRQSVVHSAVEYQDCSVIAQMGVPDMKIPIQYALLYPERLPCPTKHLSLTDYGTLTFEKPDMETFSCLKTAIAAITTGGTAPCIVNGANEVAVAAFLSGKIRFLDIGALAQKAMEMIPATKIETYEDVMRADTKAREFVRNTIA